MKTLKINILILALLMVVGISACKKDAASGTPQEQLAVLKQQEADIKAKIAVLEKQIGVTTAKSIEIPVYVQEIVPTVFKSYLNLQGTVDAEQTIMASPELPGIISNVLVKNGDRVAKGQTIATLKSSTLDEGIAEVDQQIQFAKTLYDKQQRLWQQEIGTEVQLLSAKNNYEALLKKKQTVLSQKSMYLIKAPTSGVVDAVDIKSGSAVSPGMPLGIRIVNTSNLKIKAKVAENYGSKIGAGDAAKVYFPDLRDTLKTQVSFVTKVIDPITRTFTAEINLKSNPKIRPNMTSNIDIVMYQNNKALVVPISLVQKTDNGDFVYKVDEQNIAHLTPVTLGEVYQGKVEVLNGLKVGDKVISVGYENINDGEKVKIEAN